MRYDADMRLSNQQAVTTTAYSTNTYKLKASDDLSSAGGYLLDCHIDQTFAGGTSLQIDVIGHWVPDPATAVASTVFIALGASEIMLTAANFMVAGADIPVFVNPVTQAKLDLIQTLGGFAALGLNPVSQPGVLYVSARYTVDGTMTAGKITTHIVPYTMYKRRPFQAGIAF